MIFDSQVKTLDDNAEDVRGRQDLMTPRYVDMLCIRKKFKGLTKLLFPLECKPPFKVTKEMFRVGLRPMNVITEVVNRKTAPTDANSKEYFVYHAEKIVAAAVAQTYKYMLESGCEYGCLTTGECILFLRILEKDPNTLYYHLSEPLEQVGDEHSTFLHMRTAIAQMMSLIYMAGESETRGPVWYSEAIKHAATWDVGVNLLCRAMPSSLRKSPPDSPASIPDELSPDPNARSPYLTRRYALLPDKNAAQSSNHRQSPHFRPAKSDNRVDINGPIGR